MYLAVDSNNTVYIGTRISQGAGKLYKSENGKIFNEVSEINKIVQSLTVDKNKNVYVGTNIGEVYKFENEQ